jgi:hypothetical protein
MESDLQWLIFHVPDIEELLMKLLQLTDVICLEAGLRFAEMINQCEIFDQIIACVAISQFGF